MFARSIAASAASLALAAALAAPLFAQSPVPTAFNYQGLLLTSGLPVNGAFDFELSLWDAATGGTQIGSTLTPSGVAVDEGVVDLDLDFGAGAFDGEARWLQIALRPAGGGAFTTLAPRRAIQPAPQAQYAILAENAVNDATADADANPTNEIQSLSFTSPNLAISGSNSVDLSALQDGVIDGDANPANELNTSLTLNGFSLDLVDAGGTLSADLSSLAGGGSGDGHSLDAVDGDPIDALFVENEGRVGIGILTPPKELTVHRGSILQTPREPLHLAAVNDSGATALNGAQSMFVRGDYAYVTSDNDDGLEILDISDPANPRHVGAIFDNATTELNGAASVFVSGNYAYVAAFDDDGVEIVDISDPSNPTHVGAITDNATTALNGAFSIFVQGNYAYVAADVDNGVEILDISDPTNPFHVGAIFDGGATELNGANSIFVAGDYAYVAAFDDDGVEILDISNPFNPTHVGSISDNGTTALNGARSIFVSGNYAYVASAVDDGVEILDVSDPSAPFHVGAIFDNATTELDGASSIFVAGDYAYVASIDDDGVETLDISNPFAPAHVGAITDNATTELDGAVALFVSGSHAYVAAFFDNGMEVLDVSGIEASTARIGAIAAGSLNVTDQALIASGVHVGAGLNVGTDAMIGGDLAVGGSRITARNLPSGSGTALQITASGDFLRATSSARFKENIAPAALNAEKVLQLEPVTYDYRESGQHALGYIAEQLHELGLTQLVLYDADGAPYSIAYQLIPLFHNELIKKHEARLAEKDAEIERLEERLDRIERLLNEDENRPAK